MPVLRVYNDLVESFVQVNLAKHFASGNFVGEVTEVGEGIVVRLCLGI